MPETIGLYQTVNVHDFHRAFETMDRGKHLAMLLALRYMNISKT